MGRLHSNKMDLRFNKDNPLNYSYIVVLDKYLNLVFRRDSRYASFKEVKSETEAKRWGQAFRKTIGLSDEELKNIYSYTGSWYKVINKHLLRGVFNKGIDEDTDNEIRILDESINKSPLTENIVVYRATKRKWLLPFINKDEIMNKTFWSCSLLRKSAIFFKTKERYDCIIKIYVPKGCRALYVSNIGSIDEDDWLKEYEMLLPRNSRFIILSRKLFSRYIELELVGQDNK